MIDLGHVNDYYMFFEQVTQHCKKEEHTNTSEIAHLTKNLAVIIY